VKRGRGDNGDSATGTSNPVSLATFMASARLRIGSSRVVEKVSFTGSARCSPRLAKPPDVAALFSDTE
jgi:hypothetical protein